MILIAPTNVDHNSVLPIPNLKVGFEEMVQKVWPILSDASMRGIPIDNEERERLIIYLEEERKRIYKEIQDKVPDEMRKIHPPDGYVRIPKLVLELAQKYEEGKEVRERLEGEGKKVASLDDYIAKKSYLPILKSGEETKIWGKFRLAQFKVLKKGYVFSGTGEPAFDVVERWCRVEDFNPNASIQIIRYMKVKGHKVPVKLDGNETSEAKELERLAISTKDNMYDGIIEYRQINKMLTNDIPNWKPDERTKAVHTEFGFLPATGQLNSRSPNVQNANKHKPLGKRFRRIIRARSYRDGRWAGRRRRLVEADYCVGPDTLILTDQFLWKKAGEITKEDVLVGFDEYCEGGKHRYLRESKIEEVKRLRKQCYKITTDMGEVVCSQDHRWLARGRNGSKLDWHKANDLLVGDKISYFTDTWEQDDSYEASYLAGFFDGEGYVSKTNGVGFGQNPGQVLDYVKEQLEAKGFEALPEGVGQGGCEKYAVTGGPFFGMRFIGSVRPIRLLANLMNRYEGTSVRGKLTKQATILSIEDLGEQEVIGIQSSTHTFIANGFLSHNSGFHAVMLGREAQSERYVNISKSDAHSWLTSYVIGNPVEYPKVWDKETAQSFKAKLKAIKKEYKVIRDTQSKPTILGVGLGLGPRKMYWMNRERFDPKLKMVVGIKNEAQSKQLQGVLKELLPELFEYQVNIKQIASDQTYLINRWGMIRWFFDVRGEDGEAAIAFNVQGNAHGMLRWVLRRLHEEVLYECDRREYGLTQPHEPTGRWDVISALERFHFINTIHDSLLFEPWEDDIEECIRVVEAVMMTPCMVLADRKVCPQGLIVGVESTVGENWCEASDINPNGMKAWAA